MNDEFMEVGAGLDAYCNGYLQKSRNYPESNRSEIKNDSLVKFVHWKD